VVLPGHSQLALQPATHTLFTQICPEPSLPGLQSPSVEHETPPLPVSGALDPASSAGGGDPASS
jgi:hypothetical protein